MIRLHNTLTRKKDEFVPLDPNNVRMYVCGPTVYDRAHLGNARPVIVFDVLYRLLRHVYGDDHVTYVRNFTDVDDKIIARAAETGREIGQITEETTRWYLDDMAAVGALEPTEMPRATQYIGQMVAMIGGLVELGHAYEAEGHVLFSVSSYAEYGRLSGRSVDDMIAGARVEVAPYKRDPMDFVLWKPSGEDQPGWHSPWGRGRPGWHIECSAMAHDLLGETFDIHGGGNDLQFPHHENEIAQSKCVGHGFAQVWMHNEMLQVEGKKMSKSLGNFFTVRDLLDQGVPGEVIRFVMLGTHYRKPMDWTEKKAEDAGATLQAWWKATRVVDSGSVSEAVVSRLADDLDTHGALEALKQFYKMGEFETLKASAQLLGLLLPELAWVSEQAVRQEHTQAVQELFEIYLKARETRQFEVIDRIKQSLLARGIRIGFSKSGVKIDGTDLMSVLNFYASVPEAERAEVFGDGYLASDGSSSVNQSILIGRYQSLSIRESIDNAQASS